MLNSKLFDHNPVLKAKCLGKIQLGNFSQMEADGTEIQETPVGARERYARSVSPARRMLCPEFEKTQISMKEHNPLQFCGTDPE